MDDLLLGRRCSILTANGAKEEPVGGLPRVAVAARPAFGAALPELQAAAALAHAVRTEQLAGVA